MPLRKPPPLPLRGGPGRRFPKRSGNMAKPFEIDYIYVVPCASERKILRSRTACDDKPRRAARALRERPLLAARDRARRSRRELPHHSRYTTLCSRAARPSIPRRATPAYSASSRQRAKAGRSRSRASSSPTSTTLSATSNTTSTWAAPRRATRDFSKHFHVCIDAEPAEGVSDASYAEALKLASLKANVYLAKLGLGQKVDYSERFEWNPIEYKPGEKRLPRVAYFATHLASHDTWNFLFYGQRRARLPADGRAADGNPRRRYGLALLGAELLSPERDVHQGAAQPPRQGFGVRRLRIREQRHAPRRQRDAWA